MTRNRKFYELDIKSLVIGFVIGLLTVLLGNLLYDWQHNRPSTQLINFYDRPIIATNTPRQHLLAGRFSFKLGMVRYLVMTLGGILPYIQIILSVLLIGAILLQQTGASMGGAFGGDNFSAAYHTRRGSEKVLFYATVILGVLFAASAFVALFLNK